MKPNTTPAAFERGAICPGCWQTIHVHLNQTYFAHGSRGADGDLTWCGLSNQPIRPVFPLGTQVLTVGAIEALRQAKQDPDALLKRHQHGDWGDIPPEGAAENLFSLHHNRRILSAYPLVTGETIWIITEADRSSTTLILPEEY